MDPKPHAIKPVDPTYDPKSTLKVNMDLFEINLAGISRVSGEEIEQPEFDPPICIICNGIAASPMLAHCSTQFVCVKCSQSKVCPLCKKEKCLRSDLGAMKHFVNSFIGICPYYSKGCDATFTLLDFSKHLEACPHTVYICGCNGKMQRPRIHDHYRAECPLRVQRCSYCDDHFHQSDMQPHVDDTHPRCAHCYAHYAPGDERHVPQPCPVGCELHLPPCSLKEHIKMVHSYHLFEENIRLREEVQRLRAAGSDELQRKDDQLQLLQRKLALGTVSQRSLVSQLKVKDEQLNVRSQQLIQLQRAMRHHKQGRDTPS